MFASGKNATVSANRRPARGAAAPTANAEDGESRGPVLRIERQRRRHPTGREPGQRSREQPLAQELALRPRLLRRLGAFLLAAALRQRAKLLREGSGRGPALRARAEGACDRVEHVARQIRTERLERRCTLLDAPGRLRQVAAPERMLAGESLPEQHADRPDVRGGGGGLAVQALGRDVRERAWNVAEAGQRVELGHLRQPEVEQPHVDPTRLGEEHVRRFHVAVHDPPAVSVRKGFGDLRSHLDGPGVVERSAADRLAQRAPRDVLVGDVDVCRIASERDDPLTAWVAQRRSCARLSFCPVTRLAFTRHDLQRDVEPAPLVPGQPDVAHPAGAKRPDRSVPAEEELVRLRRRGHPRELLLGGGKPFSDRLSRYIRPGWNRATTTSSSISSRTSPPPPSRRAVAAACRAAAAEAPARAGRLRAHRTGSHRSCGCSRCSRSSSRCWSSSGSCCSRVRRRPSTIGRSTIWTASTRSRAARRTTAPPSPTR